MISNFVVFAGLVATILISAYLQPSRSIPESWFGQEAFFKNENEAFFKNENGGRGDAWDRRDQEEASTNEHHHGRVQIKVYRGPDQRDEHEHFAPYGYWVKQPADDNHRR